MGLSVVTYALCKKYTDEKVSEVVGIQFVVVDELPDTGESGVIYFVPNEGSEPDIYDEYVWVSRTSSWEKIGSTDADLSGYVQDQDMVEVTTSDIDDIFTEVFGS